MIAAKTGQSLVCVLGFWHYLLELGSRSSMHGTMGALDIEELAFDLGLEEAEVTALLSAFEQRGLIEANSDLDFALDGGRNVNWEKYQGVTGNAKSNAERQKEFRNRQKSERNERNDESRYSNESNVTTVTNNESNALHNKTLQDSKKEEGKPSSKENAPRNGFVMEDFGLETPPSPPDKPQRGTRLPEDWQPTDLETAYAVKQGCSLDAVEQIAEDFRLHWIAQSGSKGVKQKWSATWQIWCRSDLTKSKYLHQRNSAGGVRKASRMAQSIDKLKQAGEERRAGQ